MVFIIKKLFYLCFVIISLNLISCERKQDIYTSIQNNKETNVSINSIINEDIVIYYAISDFYETKKYILEFSANIPQKNGTIKQQILKNDTILITQDNSKLLFNGILLDDLKEKIQNLTSIDYKELEYQVYIYKDAEKKDGIGSSLNLFKGKLET